MSKLGLALKGISDLGLKYDVVGRNYRNQSRRVKEDDYSGKHQGVLGSAARQYLTVHGQDHVHVLAFSRG